MGTPKPLKWRVFERDRFTCRYCGATGVPLEADHVFPESKGGPIVYNNLVAACEKCNREKSNKLGIYPLPVDYLERLSYANRVIEWYEEQQEQQRQAKAEAWETEIEARANKIMGNRLRKLEQWRKRREIEYWIIRSVPHLSLLFLVLGTVLHLWQVSLGFNYPIAAFVGLSLLLLSIGVLLIYKPLLSWHVKKWDNIPSFMEID